MYLDFQGTEVEYMQKQNFQLYLHIHGTEDISAQDIKIWFNWHEWKINSRHLQHQSFSVEWVSSHPELFVLQTLSQSSPKT